MVKQVSEDFQASFGSPSRIPGPTGVSAKRYRQSNSQGDDDNPDQGSSNVTTPGQSARGRKSRDKGSSGAGDNGELGGPMAQGNSKISTPGQSMKLTAEDIDVESDLDAILEGGDFSDEFKERAAQILATAIAAKVNEEVDTLADEMQDEFDNAIDEAIEEMNSKIDQYLNYVIENWMEENRLAVDSGIRSELAESFMSGIKGLMQEHYVELPEDKIDVVEALGKKVAELEGRLNEELEKNVELSAMIDDYAIDEVFADVAEGLTDSQVSKLQTLSEAITAEDIDDYRATLEKIRDSYFPDSSVDRPDSSSDEFFDEDEEIELNEDTKPRGDVAVSKYANYISRTAQKK